MKAKSGKVFMRRKSEKKSVNQQGTKNTKRIEDKDGG